MVCHEIKCIQSHLLKERLACRIEPFLYRVLVKSKSKDRIADLSVLVDKQCPLLLEFRASDEIPPRLRKVCGYARHVLLQGQLADDMVKILEMCPNVCDLAIWASNGQSVHLAKVIGSLPLERLSIDLSDIFIRWIDHKDLLGLTFRHLPYALTHLDLIDVNQRVYMEVDKNLQSLPNLTHIAVEGRGVKDIMESILSSCPSLEKVIYFDADDFEGGPMSDWPTCTDPRLVILDALGAPMDDWCRGVQTGFDFWTQAGSALIS